MKFVMAWTEIHRDELMQDWELAKDNQLKFVMAWTEIHRDELMQDWELAKDNRPLVKIAPLM